MQDKRQQTYAEQSTSSLNLQDKRQSYTEISNQNVNLQDKRQPSYSEPNQSLQDKRQQSYQEQSNSLINLQDKRQSYTEQSDKRQQSYTEQSNSSINLQDKRQQSYQEQSNSLINLQDKRQSYTEQSNSSLNLQDKRQQSYSEPSTSSQEKRTVRNSQDRLERLFEQTASIPSSNNTIGRTFPEGMERRKLEKSASERRYYSETKEFYEPKKTDIFVDDSSGVERLSFYSDLENEPQTSTFYNDVLRSDGESERRDFFDGEHRAFYAEDDTSRRDQKFFDDGSSKERSGDRRSFYGNLENEPQSSTLDDETDGKLRRKFFDLNTKIDDSDMQVRRKYLSECENDGRSFVGEQDTRRKSISLRQELRSQRSNFSESLDSASSRSQLSNFCESQDYAEKMLKSSRSYLTESDCCRLGTASSAREASDDSSPGAMTQGGVFHADAKYARKRARKCNHRRQKSLDTGRSATKQELTQNEPKPFRDFDLDEDLAKRLDRMEPKSSGYLRRNSRKSASRFDLNFDSEDERCFRHSLDVDRSFDLDFLDTSIDDRYGSFDRDFDLV